MASALTTRDLVVFDQRGTGSSGPLHCPALNLTEAISKKPYAVLLLDAAAPAALKKAKPGTPEFRAALRDALENVKNVVGTHAVYSMSPAKRSTR